MIHLAVADRSRAFADAVAGRLADELDLAVGCSATSVAALRRAAGPRPVDVVVCDAVLFGAEDQELRAFGGPPPALVLVADAADTALLAPALRRGVRGWVPREASAADLVAAVREAYRGGTWVPARLLTGAIRELTGAPAREDQGHRRLAALTPRERDVLACLADGLSRAEVATRLHLSPNTVRTHVQSILAKLRVNSSVAAVALVGGDARADARRRS